jgi:hypothetical protein
LAQTIQGANCWTDQNAIISLPIREKGGWMPIDIAMASYLLSSVASTAKIIEFALSLKEKAASKKEIDAILKKAEVQSKASVVVLSHEMSDMANKMTGPIQEAFTKKILEIRDRIVQIIGDGTLNPVERRAMLAIDQRAFCEELHNLKKWSGGSLPPDLQREWDLANCSQYTFY